MVDMMINWGNAPKHVKGIWLCTACCPNFKNSYHDTMSIKHLFNRLRSVWLTGKAGSCQWKAVLERRCFSRFSAATGLSMV